MQIHINGIRTEKINNTSTEAHKQTRIPITIGRSVNFPHSFAGLIQDMRMFDTVLTLDAVSLLMEKTKPYPILPSSESVPVHYEEIVPIKSISHLKKWIPGKH
jgi:hypothetical protein